MSRTSKDDPIFKALADHRRREILDILRNGPKTTGDLCARFARELDRCTVMQHLGVLEAAGLVIAKREGRIRWNYLDAVPIRKIYNRWISGYAGPAVEILARMKKDMEDGSV